MVSLAVNRQMAVINRALAAPPVLAEPAIDETLPRAQALPPKPEGTTEAPAPDGFNKVAAYIPSEVLGLYIAGLGIFGPDTNMFKWLVFGVAAALIPLLVVLSGKGTDNGGRARRLSAKSLVLLSLIGIVDFCAWTASLPGTPFLALTSYANKLGGFAILVLAVVLPPASKTLGLA